MGVGRPPPVARPASSGRQALRYPHTLSLSPNFPGPPSRTLLRDRTGKDQPSTSPQLLSRPGVPPASTRHPQLDNFDEAAGPLTHRNCGGCGDITPP